MTESELHIIREPTLFQNANQTVIRQTADFLDKLQDAPWLDDRDAAREYLGTKTYQMINSMREGFHRFDEELNPSSLKSGIKEASKIRRPELITANGQFIHYPKPSEPFGFALVILSHMKSSLSEEDLRYFKPPESQMEYLQFTEELENQVIGIAVKKNDPKEISDNPSYRNMARFFRVGRRIPIKLVESENEKKARVDFELNKMFGHTS